MAQLSDFDNFLVYRNVHNEEFYLTDILYYLKQGWSGRIKPKVDFNYERLFKIAQFGNVGSAYVRQLKQYFSVYSRNGRMNLGGGCGGISVTESDFDTLNPLKSINNINILSTSFRLSSNPVEDVLKNKKDEDEYGSLNFRCPACNGEHRRPPHELIKICPTNGKEIPKC